MRKYLINLDKRKDKLETVTKELHRVGIKNWIRYPAIDMPDGHRGCTESHMHVLNMAPNTGTFFVMEDDIKFLQPLSVLRKAMGQLPDDWDCLFLGATLTEPQERYSDNLFRLTSGWTTHGVLWNNRNGVKDYALNNLKDSDRKIDVYYNRTIKQKFNCFVTFPMVATQTQGFSDTMKNITINTLMAKQEVFKDYPNPIFIETGSYLGEGINHALELNYNRIISIEIDPLFYNRCLGYYNNEPRVELYFGSSLDLLPSILKTVHKPATFWLDAHIISPNQRKSLDVLVPLIEELNIIKQHVKQTNLRHTILIDDIRNFRKDGGWVNIYIDDIINKIKEIRCDYKIHYEYGVTDNDILIAS